MTRERGVAAHELSPLLEANGLSVTDAALTPPRNGVPFYAARIVEIRISFQRASTRTPAPRDYLPESLRIDGYGLADGARVSPGALVRAVDEWRSRAGSLRRDGPRARTWLKVVLRDMVPTGFELAVLDERDAERQLDLLTRVAPLERGEITIKPKPGWEGYGDTSVFRVRRLS